MYTRKEIIAGETPDENVLFLQYSKGYKESLINFLAIDRKHHRAGISTTISQVLGFLVYERSFKRKKLVTFVIQI